MRCFIILALIPLHFPSVAQEYARVLSHSTTYTIQENETAEIEENYKIEILSEKGQSFGIYKEYIDKFRRVSEVTMDIFDHDGRKIKRLKRSDGVEIGFNPANEITDGKMLLIESNFMQYPFTMEVHSRIKLDGFVSLPVWVPRFQFHMSVAQSSLQVIRPVSVRIKFREENIEGVTERLEDKLVTRYSVSNLLHTDNKLRYQDFYKEQPKVFVSPEKFKLDDMVGSNASWTDFGNWYLTLNSSPYALNKKTTDFINTLSKADEKDLIRRIYEYMQDKTRYVSIQLGIGGFKSLPTEEVENYGYGDCKALTTYMKNMLDYAGVKSNYVLVKAGKDAPDVVADFPGNQFNHVFLGIPTQHDTVYLECTSQISPANYTGSFTDDRNMLWIENGRSVILRSRVYDHTRNLQLNTIRIDLREDGSATVDREISNKGIFFDELMVFKLAPSDYIKDYIQSKFNYDDFIVKTFSYDQSDRSRDSFSSKYKLQINGMAKVVSDRLVIPIMPSTPFHAYIDKDNLKKFYAIRRGVTIIDEIEVILPQGYWVYNLPEAEEVNSAYGAYSLTMKFDGNKLRISRKLILYKGDYASDRYQDFKSFYQKLENIEKRKLVLNAKT